MYEWGEVKKVPGSKIATTIYSVNGWVQILRSSRKFDVINGRLLTAIYNYFVPWYWHLIFLGQLQHCATIQKFLCDFYVLLWRGANNIQANLFPPCPHLCLLGMTLCPNFHNDRLRIVLKKLLKLDNIMWLKVGVYFIIQANLESQIFLSEIQFKIYVAILKRVAKNNFFSMWICKLKSFLDKVFTVNFFK